MRKKGKKEPDTPPAKIMVNIDVKENLLRLTPLYTVSVKNDIIKGDNNISIDHPKKCGHVTESVNGLYKNNSAPKDFDINLSDLLDSFTITSIKSKKPIVEMYVPINIKKFCAKIILPII